MNYILHLTGFFEKVSEDEHLNPSHISLYVSLFQLWNVNRFQNPFSVAREEVMRISKIGSKATYHKCIKELDSHGYIQYKPSHNPFKGSLVHLFCFDKSNNNSFENRTSAEPVLNRENTKKGTSTEQALVPFINKGNNTNNKTLENRNAPLQNEDIDLKNLKETVVKRKNVPEKKEKDSGSNVLVKNDSGKNIPPDLEEVKSYFELENYPALEALKFFNYFQSNGWKVGGKAPMKNWQASAINWMLNSEKFNKKNYATSAKERHSAGNLSSTTNKDFSEPL